MKTALRFVTGVAAAMLTAIGEDARVEATTTNSVVIVRPAATTRFIPHKEAVDEIVSGKTTFKGPLVVLVKKHNPFVVFNPFRSDTASTDTERPLRDPYLGAPRGIVLFSVSR